MQADGLEVFFGVCMVSLPLGEQKETQKAAQATSDLSCILGAYDATRVYMQLEEEDKGPGSGWIKLGAAGKYLWSLPNPDPSLGLICLPGLMWTCTSN